MVIRVNTVRRLVHQTFLAGLVFVAIGLVGVFVTWSWKEPLPGFFASTAIVGTIVAVSIWLPRRCEGTPLSQFAIIPAFFWIVMYIHAVARRMIRFAGYNEWDSLVLEIVPAVLLIWSLGLLVLWFRSMGRRVDPRRDDLDNPGACVPTSPRPTPPSLAAGAHIPVD